VPGRLRTARRDLADFLLAQLNDPTYFRKGVAIASDL
jgi:hypothetical protein